MAGRCKIREFGEQLSLRLLITQYYRLHETILDTVIDIDEHLERATYVYQNSSGPMGRRCEVCVCVCVCVLGGGGGGGGGGGISESDMRSCYHN